MGAGGGLSLAGLASGSDIGNSVLPIFVEVSWLVVATDPGDTNSYLEEALSKVSSERNQSENQSI